MNSPTENEKLLLQRIAQLEHEKRQKDLQLHGNKQRFDDDLFALEVENTEKQEKIDELQEQLEKVKNRCMLKVLEVKTAYQERLKEERREVESSTRTSQSQASRDLQQMQNELKTSIDRSNKCSEQNKALHVANEQLRDELAKLRKKCKEVEKEKKEREDRQKLAEIRKNRFSPYDAMKNYEYKNKRVDLTIEELRRISGQGDPVKLANDALSKLGKENNLKTKLSDYEAFLLYHNTGMTRDSYTKIRRCLKKKNIFNPFPPLSAIIRMELKHGSKETYDIKRHIKKDGSGEKVVISAEMKNIKEFLIQRLQELSNSGKLMFDRCTGKKIWVSVTGDKGGDEFKLSLAIGNLDSPNSCYSLIPVGIFNDDETTENIHRYIPNTIHQLNDLKEVKLMMNGEEKKFEIEQFLCGDLKNLYEMLGHQGARSTFHCLYCYHSEKGHVRDYVRGRAVEKRTEEGYAEDSLRLPTRKNGNPNHARRNVKYESSFVFSCVKLANVIPPSLHILMGISQKYAFNRLIRLAREMDNKSGKQLQKNKLTTERKEKAEITISENDVVQKKCHLHFLMKVDRVIQKYRDHVVDCSDDEEEGGCDAEWCLFRDKEMKDVEPRLVECAMCDRYFHGACAGTWSPEAWELAKSAHTDTFCFQCTGTSKDNIKKQILKAVDDMTAEVETSEKILKEKKDAYLNRLEAAGGHLETMKMLEEAWRSLGADISAWQQNFVGNHVLKLLEPAAIDVYLNVFSKTAEMEHMKNFLVAMGSLQKLCVARELTDDEIEEMEELIGVIWEELQLLAPEETVTPKLHVLLEHVMPYIRRFRTWAKTSEQAIESQHAVYNRLKKKYAFLRHPEEKISQILRSLMYHTRVHDNF